MLQRSQLILPIAFIASGFFVISPSVFGQGQNNSAVNGVTASQTADVNVAPSIGESRNDSSLATFFQINPDQKSSSSNDKKNKEKSSRKENHSHGVLWHILDNFGVPMLFSGNGPMFDPSLSPRDTALGKHSSGAGSPQANDLRPSQPGDAMSPIAVPRENKIPRSELDGTVFETGTDGKEKANSR